MPALVTTLIFDKVDDVTRSGINEAKLITAIEYFMTLPT